MVIKIAATAYEVPMARRSTDWILYVIFLLCRLGSRGRDSCPELPRQESSPAGLAQSPPPCQAPMCSCVWHAPFPYPFLECFPVPWGSMMPAN